MHRRNHSLDRLAGVIVGSKESSSGGFSYGTTPPLTHPPTPAQQAKLQLEKQKYKERHQHLRGEFSQSAESLNSRDQDLVLTPMSSTSALSTTNTSRTSTYPPGNQGSGRRDSSYFPPTPPASIRVASPAGTPRGHSHSASQQSNISERGSTSRSSTPTSLNGLFPSNGSMAPTSAPGVQGGKKPRTSAASSIRSRFTFLGGGGDKDKAHGRQGSVGGNVYANQMQQQQQYLQHLLQEEERLQQEDAPLPPLPPPTSPAQRDREWADQSDRSSIRRRSVNSVHSNETGRRTPTSPEEARRGLGVVSTMGANPQRDFEDGASGTRRSGSISTVRTHRTASIVYDQDVDMSRMEDLLGPNSPIGPDGGEDSDAGGGTPTSITPSMFRQNRKELEGTGIATGESTMIGNVIYVDGKLVRVNGSGSAMTIASIASTGTMRSIDNFPLVPQPPFLNVDDREPLSPLPATSMQLPPSSPSSQTSLDNSPVTAEQEPVKRSPSSSSTMSQVKRKPSPVTMSFPAAASLPGTNTPSTPLPSVAEPDLSKPPTPPPQTPLPPPPIITTSEPAIPNNPITNSITSPLRNNAGETAVPTAWGGRALQMEISQVELPPPPPHTRSPLGDSPLAVQYPVERKKKMIDEEWEDMEREDSGEGDAPPPPYVPRMSMLVQRNEEGEGEGMWEDEKAMLRRAEMMNRRSLPMRAPSRQSTFQEEPTVEALNANNSDNRAEEIHDDSAMMRPPTTALPSDRADFESQRRWKGENEVPSPITNRRTMQRSTAATTIAPITTKNRSNPNSAANSPTVGRKRTILKKPGATPKLSPGLNRSNTRGKLRFSHVAPEVVIPPLPNTASPPVTEAAETGKGKQCKTCKQVKGGSLANKYRELLTRERESFSLERSIWEEERKGYDKKIADLEKRMRRLVEVLARGDEGGEDEEHAGETFEEHAVEDEDDEVEDVQPVMSATGGLSLGPSSTSVRKNSFRDTGKEVDRSQMNQPSRDRTGGSWPRQTGLPTPPATGAISSFNRQPATSDSNPEGSGGGDQYWSTFLDEYRGTSRCVTVPPTHITSGSGSGSNYGYGASSSASSSSWGATSRTWSGAGSSSSATTWDTGSHTHGGWRQEELDPKMKLPITEERAVYARLYAEASIGIGGPSGDLVH